MCKPSEFTSLTAHLLCDCFLKAGLPEGVYYNFIKNLNFNSWNYEIKVCNIVFGYGHRIGNDLVTHPEINLISFTGGTLTGSKIRSATANHSNKKLSLELGGKNAGIVFPDADLDKFINDIGRSCFQNSGQM